MGEVVCAISLPKSAYQYMGRVEFRLQLQMPDTPVNVRLQHLFSLFSKVVGR